MFNLYRCLSILLLNGQSKKRILLDKRFKSKKEKGEHSTLSIFLTKNNIQAYLVIILIIVQYFNKDLRGNAINVFTFGLKD